MVLSFGAQCQLNHEVNVAVISLIAMSGQAMPLTACGTSHSNPYTEHSDLQLFHTARIPL